MPTGLMGRHVFAAVVWPVPLHQAELPQLHPAAMQIPHSGATNVTANSGNADCWQQVIAGLAEQDEANGSRTGAKGGGGYQKSPSVPGLKLFHDWVHVDAPS